MTKRMDKEKLCFSNKIKTVKFSFPYERSPFTETMCLWKLIRSKLIFRTSFSSKKFDYLKIPTEQIITFKNECISPS